MSDHEHHISDEIQHVISIGSRHRFMVMIGAVVVVAFILVVVSMSLYRTSGSALLDLSLPRLQAARDQITEPKTSEEFPTTGPINENTLAEFSRLYDKQVKNATGVDAYNGDAITDSALSIDDVPAEQVNQ